MRYEVNGVFFESLSEAEEYEKKLHEEYEATKKRAEFMRYKQALAEKLRVYKATDNNEGKVLYFAVIVDNKHDLYAYAMAEDTLGKRYTLNNTGLKVNWYLEREDELFDSILNSIVYGRASEVEDVRVYQGVSIDVDDEQVRRDCATCLFDLVCPKNRCFKEG